MSDRIQEIKNVVDEMLRRITLWCEDPSGPGAMPEPVMLGIKRASLVARGGDIPRCCQDLCIIAMQRLLVETQGYENQEHGKFRADTGAPGTSFWAALKAVMAARKGAEAPVLEKLEPVHLLVEQGVGTEQIGRHMYGNGRGRGPFMLANDVVDVAAIAKEAKTPGSVLGPTWESWIPPWKAEAAQMRMKEMETQLQAFDHLESGRRYEDPATIEGMIRDGCSIQQIQMGKGATRKQILAVAEECGLEVKDREGIVIVGDDNDGFEEDDATSGLLHEQEGRPDLKTDGVREAVVAIWEESGRQMGSPEVAHAVRQSGLDCTPHRAGQIIGAHKRKETVGVE